LYEIEDIEYAAEAIVLIKSTINKFYDKIEEDKKKGSSINSKALQILEAKGYLDK